MATDWIMALVGGVFIGLAASLLLFLNGRVLGVTGIVNGIVDRKKGDVLWRWYLVIGMIAAGFAAKAILPTVFSGSLPTENWTLAVAGLLVGFGTVLGSGCTSGHGVCGISRLSPRSLVATAVFIGTGVLTVAILKMIGVFS